MRPIALAALLVCALVAAAPSAVAAQTISITQVSPASVTEGDDFFTTVMNNTLDFDERRDFMWEEQFNEATITAAGGVWSGQFATPGAYVFPLFAGLPLALNSGRLGANFPLDSAKYTLLSIKSRVSAPSVRVVYWSRDVSFPDDSLSNAPGVFEGSRPTSTFAVDLYDFSGNAAWTAAPIRAIRLDPSAAGPAGTTVQYDWVRISDPTSSPAVTIQWSISGAPAGAEVNVYIDDDAAGFDGTLFAHVPFSGSTPTSVTFPSSALPPGTYFFYVQLVGPSGGAALDTSGYSGAFVVNGKTRITFDNPSMTSGPDYATTELGNPWDLDSAADIDRSRSSSSSTRRSAAIHRSAPSSPPRRSASRRPRTRTPSSSCTSIRTGRSTRGSTAT